MSKLERLNRHGTRRHFTTAGIAWGHEHRHAPGRAESEAQQQQQQARKRAHLRDGSADSEVDPRGLAQRGDVGAIARRGRERQRRRWRGVPLGRPPSPRRDGREGGREWEGSRRRKATGADEDGCGGSECRIRRYAYAITASRPHSRDAARWGPLLPAARWVSSLSLLQRSGVPATRRQSEASLDACTPESSWTNGQRRRDPRHQWRSNHDEDRHILVPQPEGGEGSGLTESGRIEKRRGW